MGWLMWWFTSNDGETRPFCQSASGRFNMLVGLDRFGSLPMGRLIPAAWPPSAAAPPVPPASVIGSPAEPPEPLAPAVAPPLPVVPLPPLPPLPADVDDLVVPDAVALPGSEQAPIHAGSQTQKTESIRVFIVRPSR